MKEISVISVTDGLLQYKIRLLFLAIYIDYFTTWKIAKATGKTGFRYTTTIRLKDVSWRTEFLNTEDDKYSLLSFDEFISMIEVGLMYQ